MTQEVVSPKNASKKDEEQGLPKHKADLFSSKEQPLRMSRESHGKIDVAPIPQFAKTAADGFHKGKTVIPKQADKDLSKHSQQSKKEEGDAQSKHSKLNKSDHAVLVQEEKQLNNFTKAILGNAEEV